MWSVIRTEGLIRKEWLLIKACFCSRMTQKWIMLNLWAITVRDSTLGGCTGRLCFQAKGSCTTERAGQVSRWPRSSCLHPSPLPFPVSVDKTCTHTHHHAHIQPCTPPPPAKASGHRECSWKGRAQNSHLRRADLSADIPNYQREMLDVENVRFGSLVTDRSVMWRLESPVSFRVHRITRVVYLTAKTKETLHFRERRTLHWLNHSYSRWMESAPSWIVLVQEHGRITGNSFVCEMWLIGCHRPSKCEASLTGGRVVGSTSRLCSFKES